MGSLRPSNPVAGGTIRIAARLNRSAGATIRFSGATEGFFAASMRLAGGTSRFEAGSIAVEGPTARIFGGTTRFAGPTKPFGAGSIRPVGGSIRFDVPAKRTWAASVQFDGPSKPIEGAAMSIVAAPIAIEATSKGIDRGSIRPNAWTDPAIAPTGSAWKVTSRPEGVENEAIRLDGKATCLRRFAWPTSVALVKSRTCYWRRPCKHAEGAARRARSQAVNLSGPARRARLPLQPWR